MWGRGPRGAGRHVFGSEAAFLDRHGLLSAAERKRLGELRRKAAALQEHLERRHGCTGECGGSGGE